MERWCRHYGIATYGPAPNWRRPSVRRPAKQGLPKPVLGLSLEAVNGHRQRLSCDGSSGPPWGARNDPEYDPPDVESNDRSTRSLEVVQNQNRLSGDIQRADPDIGKRPFDHEHKSARSRATLLFELRPRLL